MDSYDLDFDFKIDLTDKTENIRKNENPNNTTTNLESNLNGRENNNNTIQNTIQKLKTNEDVPISPDKAELEQLKKETLTSIVEKAINDSKLNEYLHLKTEEIVSSSNCIKKLKVEGRVGRDLEKEFVQLQKRIYENLSVKLGRNFRKEEFWLAECGIRVGEKYEKLEAYDINYNPVEIIHKQGTLLVIDFWSYWSDVNSYLSHRIQTLKNIEDGKLEGVTLDKIKSFSISGEENEKIWKSIANNETLNKYIPQYQSQLIYYQVGIEKVPSIMIINKEGIVSYIGTYRDINFEQSLQNLLQDKPIVLASSDQNINYENNPNSWWLELDNESKIDIVREINFSLRQMGCNFSSFLVVTDSIHYLNSVKNVTRPMFVGNMSEGEYEVVQSFAIELQNSWNLNDIKFNVKVLNYY